MKAFRIGHDHRVPPAGYPGQGDKVEGDSTAEQHHALNRIGPHHGGKAALHGVEPDDRHRAPQHGGETPTCELGKDERAAVEHRHHEHQRVGRQHDPTIDVAAKRSESLGEVLGKGSNPVLKIDRNKENQEQRVRGQAPPFPVGDGHAVLISRANRADNLLAGNARGYECRTDDPPRQPLRRQEVAPRRLALAARCPQAHDHHQDERRRDDADVQTTENEARFTHGKSLAKGVRRLARHGRKASARGTPTRSPVALLRSSIESR